MTTENLGAFIRSARKRLGVTQRDLALTSGTGPRFLSDLEHGKPTCELGKALRVMNTLGITLQVEASTGERLVEEPKKR